MGLFVFILPLICMAIGHYIGFQLRMRHALRPLGLMVLAAAGGFTISVQAAQSAESASQATSLAAAVVAFLVIMPAAVGLLTGAGAGWLRLRRMRRTNAR